MSLSTKFAQLVAVSACTVAFLRPGSEALSTLHPLVVHCVGFCSRSVLPVVTRRSCNTPAGRRLTVLLGVRSLERGLNGDHTLHKLEELYGSYHNFILLSAVTHLLRAVIVQNYPHTDQHAGTPTGWEVFSRILGLTYFQTLASLSLSAKNVRFPLPLWAPPI